MNTDFNILWFEDTDEWYNSIKIEIEDYLYEFNFHAHIDRFKYVQNDEIIDAIRNKNYDLVLADLNLDKQHKGGDAINLIRDNQLLADALFYSTDGIDKIRASINNEVLEGVYLSNRDDILFIEKTKKLIYKLIKRSEDVINVRGLLMDNVSEFDEKLKEVIKKFLAVSSDDVVTKINKYAYDKTIMFYKEKFNKIEDSGDDGFVISSIDSSFILDSYKLSMIVNKIFKDYYPDYYEMNNFHDSYNKNILIERNQLAHAKKEPEKDGNFYFLKKDGKKVIYNSDKCNQIRKNINYYNSLLDKIIDVIN